MRNMEMNNYWKHFCTVMKHKYYVFMEMRKYHLYIPGLTHDMSKFSWTEFKSAKYYTGTSSPLDAQRNDIGYSPSWLHHFHRNKHHWEYWYDVTTGKLAPIPRRYLIEMVCDIVAASRAYNGKNYTPDMPIEYLKNAGKHPPELKKILLPMLTQHLRGER